jgi:NADPH-dependent curcumin reductase CurA
MCILFLFENTRLQTLLSQGKLVWKETVTEEFENLPQAFVGMLRGDSVDKPHVKA